MRKKHFFYFFPIIIFIIQTYEIKNITITRYHCIFPAPGKNEKIKQSNIEVTMIIKVITNKLCSN